jgi:hypothetical protein
MRARTRVVLFLAPALWIAILAVALAGNAFAGTAWQGDDYSYGASYNQRCVICDGEADGNTAYVAFQSYEGNWYRVEDLDGSSGSCWWNSNPVASGVYRHRTCEDRNNWPDPCSEHSYH